MFLLVFGDVGKVGVLEIACAFFFFWFLLGDPNAEKWSEHQEKKFFINKSVEVLIPLKEGYQSLLKLHVPLGAVPARGRGEGGGWEGGWVKENSQKGNFVWSREIMCEEACQHLLKSFISFGGGLDGCMQWKKKKKMGRQQKEEVLKWKVGKCCMRRRLVKILRNGPLCVTAV